MHLNERIITNNNSWDCNCCGFKSNNKLDPPSSSSFSSSVFGIDLITLFFWKYQQILIKSHFVALFGLTTIYLSRSLSLSFFNSFIWLASQTKTTAAVSFCFLGEIEKQINVFFIISRSTFVTSISSISFAFLNPLSFF